MPGDCKSEFFITLSRFKYTIRHRETKPQIEFWHKKRVATVGTSCWYRYPNKLLLPNLKTHYNSENLYPKPIKMYNNLPKSVRDPKMTF